MKFETLTKREVIKSVASRWKRQYCLDGRWLWADNELIYRELQTLDLDTCSEADVTAIIDNDSWTRLKCNHCEQNVDKICFLRSHSQDEFGNCSYCVECLRGALKEMERE